MASEVEIVNIALTRIGEKTILVLTDDSDRARAANVLYAPTRDEVLAAFPWNFSIQRATLAQLAGAPVYGFKFAYQVPADALRVLETDLDDAPWRREGNTILSDRSSVAVKYIARITDPNRFSAQFISALAYRLAADLAEIITGKAAVAQAMFNKFNEALRAARGTQYQEDGVEQHPGIPKEDSPDLYRPLLDVR